MYLELFFKNLPELKNGLTSYSKLIPNGVNLPNKGKISGEYYRQAVEEILKHDSKLKPVIHYSLKYEYKKSVDYSYNRFLDFLQNYGPRIKGLNGEILLVSGGKKKALDSVLCLEKLKAEKINLPKLGVAYNPYQPDLEMLEVENHRLRSKIRTGIVTSVWLEFGTDLKKLQKGVDYVKALDKDVKLHGSVFIPNTHFLTKFELKPWKGVYLSEQYLESSEKAMEFTKELVKEYKRLNIEPLILNPIKTENDVRNLNIILGNGIVISKEEELKIMKNRARSIKKNLFQIEELRKLHKLDKYQKAKLDRFEELTKELNAITVKLST